MSSIPTLIRKGVITGLRTEGVPLRLYLAVPSQASEAQDREE
jgi:hypothetical protein